MDAGLKSVVEFGQYFTTKGNGEQFYAKACREYAHPRRDGTSQPRDGSMEAQKLNPCWKLRPVACIVNLELKSEFCFCAKTALNLGSEILMDQFNMWLIQIKTTQKFLQIYLKNKRHNRM